jgi:hypothetical protein
MTGTLRRLSLHAAALALFAPVASLAPAGAQQAAKPAPSQQPAKPARTGQRAAAAPRPNEAARRQARERREAAAVIQEVAAAAKAVEDPSELYSLLVECADALWPADQPAARLIFRRAWDAAGEADLETHRAEQQRPEQLLYQTEARREVAAAAARRDTRLAEEFIGALHAWAETLPALTGDDEEEGVLRRRPRRCDADKIEGYRLGLAGLLLDDGQPEPAAQVAAPLARCAPDAAFIFFLLRLRAQSAAQADRLFLATLAAIRADSAAHVNDALITHAYLTRPNLIKAVNAEGHTMAIGATATGQSDQPLPARLRAAFYETAATILLRPNAASASAGNSPAVLYFAVSQLLPFFEREAARYAPALHARRAALAAEVEPARRTMIERQAALQELAAKNPIDPLGSYRDRIAETSAAAAGDDLRLDATRAAARRRIWERARQFARDIEDEEKRRSAHLAINAYQLATLDEAFSDPKEQDVESAAGFARAADVPTALRALGLAHAAQLAAKRGDRSRALELLDETLARAAEADAPLRVAAAFVAAERASSLNSPRVWEALAAAVRALNSELPEALPGRERYLRDGETAEADAETFEDVFGEYSLDELFAAVAAQDFTRALAEARLIKDAVARSRSLVAAARAVIERKEPAPSVNR